jgi:ribosomal protein S18 acetylase RimI-like enzyme
MFKAKQICQSHGAKKLKWEVQEDNHKAINFYKRLGAEVNIKGVCHWSAE